jgi:hypothetical protein
MTGSGREVGAGREVRVGKKESAGSYAKQYYEKIRRRT